MSCWDWDLYCFFLSKGTLGGVCESRSHSLLFLLFIGSINYILRTWIRPAQRRRNEERVKGNRYTKHVQEQILFFWRFKNEEHCQTRTQCAIERSEITKLGSIEFLVELCIM